MLNRPFEDTIRENANREAAVLVGVIDSPNEPRILLTQRTQTMRTHSGQIAFPGGRADEDDRSVEHTALREMQEETGIGADHIEIVGRLPIYLSGSGYRIHPILGVISGDYTIVPNADEVALVFDVPLSFLMDGANHKMASRDWQGAPRYFYEIPYKEHYIWGVTAGILRVMYERLYR
ncbi:MAG: CoA pyrophosphatase [Ahrensia sp.]|nr:CoA pyrophosphatase [Ahrensia sp.]